MKTRWILALAGLTACASPALNQWIPDPRFRPVPPPVRTNYAALPEAVSNNAVASVNRDGRPYFYSFFGLAADKDATAASRNAFEYDLLADRWTALPPVPVNQGRLAAAAVSAGGRIYLAGGYTVARDGSESTMAELFLFDPESRQYRQLQDIPVPVDDSVFLNPDDRYLYLVSGWHQSGNVRAVQIFDTVEEAWLAGTDFPGIPVFGHAGAALANVLLIADGVEVLSRDSEGRRRYGVSDQVWLGEINPDDPTDINWRRAPSHPGAPLYRAGGAAIEERNWMVIAGGSNTAYNYNGIGYTGSPATPSDNVWIFDLASEDWVAARSKRYPSMDHRGLVSDGTVLYTIGGMGPSGVTTGAIITALAADPPEG